MNTIKEIAAELDKHQIEEKKRIEAGIPPLRIIDYVGDCPRRKVPPETMAKLKELGAKYGKTKI